MLLGLKLSQGQNGVWYELQHQSFLLVSPSKVKDSDHTLRVIYWTGETAQPFKSRLTSKNYKSNLHHNSMTSSISSLRNTHTLTHIYTYKHTYTHVTGSFSPTRQFLNSHSKA